MDREKLITVATISLRLDRFTDIEVAAMNNALSGFGHVPKGNLSFSLAKDLLLIDENGKPLGDAEDFLEALSYQIHKRPAFGITKE